MRACLLPCLILLTAAPAHADLQDVRARVSGSEGRVWLAFDSQPTTLEIRPGATGADLIIGGVSVAPHQLSPASRELVTALDVAPTASGAQIHLEGAQAWQSVSAQLRTGGVLVTIMLGSGAGSDASPRVASSYPPVDPNWAPTPLPGDQVAQVQPASDTTPYTETLSTDALEVVSPTTPQMALANHREGQLAAPAAAAPASAPATVAAASTAARASALPAQAATMAAAALPPGTNRCQTAAADFEANPWNDTSLMIHAGCLSAAGDITTAAILYQQMLAFEPDNVDAALGLANIRVQQGDPVAARALYNVAASHATSDAQAAYARNQADALQHH